MYINNLENKIPDIFKSFPVLKKKYKFNIGTTSYIYPEDIIPNIIAIADIVDEIEIILFQGKEYSNLPNKKTISILNELKEKYNINYNIHLPIDIKLLSLNELERKISFNVLREVYNITRSLEPVSYTIHIEPFNENIYKNIKNEIILELKNIFDLKIPVCIENVDINFDKFAKDFIKSGFFICIDIGHLLVFKQNIYEHFQKYEKYTKIIHLHGIKNGKDHKDILNIDNEIIKFIVDKCSKNNISLILEMFDTNDIKCSLERFKKL